MTARESHLVELVDADGVALGSATVADAHTAPGQLHRAFSVFLRDPSGRVLLQQRAPAKTRFPLRWANTCCGHPLPDEPLTVAAARRLVEEVGVADVPLTEVGVYAYYAEDPATGRVEYEYDHVLVGDLPVGVRPAPDPDEVADLRWVPVPTLLAELESDSRSYAPWLLGVTQRLAASSSGTGAASSSGTAASSGLASSSGTAASSGLAASSSGTVASVDAGFVEPDGR